MGAPKERLIAGQEEWMVAASATNSTITPTKAAEAQKDHWITGFSVSANSAPLTPVTVSIRQGGGATIRHQLQIPAAAFAPIIYEFKYALRIPENTDVDITMPALGAGVTGRLELMGFTVPT